MNRCRKCGRLLAKEGKTSKRLRCDACKYFVDQEISGERSRSFRFYFEYRLKCKRQ